MNELSENPAAYISSKWSPIYEALCKRGGVFEKMTTLFTLCAGVGHLIEERTQLEKRKDIFKWFTLDSKTEVPVLTSIAWAARDKELAVLSQKKDIIEISTEYAEGGMQYLYDNFFEDHLQDGHLISPEKLDIEFNLAQIIEGLRQRQSLF